MRRGGDRLSRAALSLGLKRTDRRDPHSTRFLEAARAGRGTVWKRIARAVGEIQRTEIQSGERFQWQKAYANEMAWREDNRRKPNGMQCLMIVNAALAHSVSREWKGYWQRAI